VNFQHWDLKHPDPWTRESLLRQMPKGAICAEIGVWLGDFSTEILEVTKPKSLHLIDPWKYETDGPASQSLYGGKVGESQEYIDSVYDTVLERFARELRSGTVVLHRAASSEAALTFPDEYFDWIYIDGNHLYEFVKRDLESYHSKVKQGGYITGDEYGEPGWWDGGVEKAVDEFVAVGSCELIAILKNQFILKRL
jgi:hypothetical protein